jgi:hypothetical protein|nr:MAG TPA: Pulmonary surfactant-associated protein D, c-type lectin, alpha-helical coiled [Caudoviricetes sp.]
MADDNIRHVNCASDFRIVFAFSGGKLPDYPWRLGLKTPNTPSYNMYVASFDGTTYNNCSPLDDESIMVFVDHHRLAPGILHYYLQTDAPDSLFPDREMNVTIPGTVNIELWEGPSDGDTPPEVTVIVERLLKGDKGDPGEAGPAGPEGPVGPKGDTPEITADEQGNIYSDGELVTSVVAEAAIKMRMLFETAGAIYNEETGFYQMNGIDDLTEADLMKAWMYHDVPVSDAVSDANFSSRLNGETTIRTNFKFYRFFRKCNVLNLYGQNKMEVFASDGIDSDQPLYIKGMSVFGCNSMKKILGVIDVYGVSKTTDITNSGMNTSLSKLESIFFKRLNVSLNILGNSPYISYESLAYLLEHASNTSPITITVHPTTYGYLTGTMQPTAQVGGTGDEWKALVQTAQSRQISFATA